jgi:hypothetical protein
MNSLVRDSILILVLLVCPIANSQTILQGDIVQYVKVIRSWIPGQGSEAFVIPSDQDIAAFQEIFLNVKENNFKNIQSVLTPFNYSFFKFYDQASTETLYVIVENTPPQRGWGTFIYYPNSLKNIMVEVPHPIWDINTWEMGINTFMTINAKWFIMAGTHRYANSDGSSDMAHVTQSIFHTAHTTIASYRAVQIHGFSKTNNPGYPDVVMSNGTRYPPNEIYNLQTNYRSEGFSVGVYSASTSSALGNLGATTNKQGQWSVSHGKLFYHIEHDNPLRTESAKMNQAIKALQRSFQNPTENSQPVTVYLNQNYPNPFNSSTNIEFKLSPTDRYSFKVYAMNGEEIAQKYTDDMESDNHRIIFMPANLSSGIYIYSVQTPYWSESKKMALIK